MTQSQNRFGFTVFHYAVWSLRLGIVGIYFVEELAPDILYIGLFNTTPFQMGIYTRTTAEYLSTEAHAVSY